MRWAVCHGAGALGSCSRAALARGEAGATRRHEQLAGGAPAPPVGMAGPCAWWVSFGGRASCPPGPLHGFRRASSGVAWDRHSPFREAPSVQFTQFHRDCPPTAYPRLWHGLSTRTAHPTPTPEQHSPRMAPPSALRCATTLRSPAGESGALPGCPPVTACRARALRLRRPLPCPALPAGRCLTITAGHEPVPASPRALPSPQSTRAPWPKELEASPAPLVSRVHRRRRCLKEGSDAV